MINVGDAAPTFELPSADLEMFESKSLAGRAYVLYFYPKDDTPGCTVEAQEFSDLLEEFEQAGATVLGVSRDTCLSHADFRDKHGLTVQLLADIEGQLCEAYGVLAEREKDGQKRTVIRRSTFVIDRDGVVRHADLEVKAKGHAERMLEIVRAL